MKNNQDYKNAEKLASVLQMAMLVSMESAQHSWFTTAPMPFSQWNYKLAAGLHSPPHHHPKQRFFYDDIEAAASSIVSRYVRRPAGISAVLVLCFAVAKCSPIDDLHLHGLQNNFPPLACSRPGCYFLQSFVVFLSASVTCSDHTFLCLNINPEARSRRRRWLVKVVLIGWIGVEVANRNIAEKLAGLTVNVCFLKWQCLPAAGAVTCHFS